MLKAFKEHIESKKLFTTDDRLLLAISGGIDSVVLAHLLKASGYHFSMAHCNFGLRKKDSQYDEEFCLQLSKNLEVAFFSKHLDVKAHQKKNKVSVQMAAREMRYSWFYELLQDKKLNYLLTAHHGNDVIETVFINFLRGTGINGLKGIPEKTGYIVRPLLIFTKQEILNYATENKLNFRLDKSNLEDKYERNFLRLNILPALKKIHPNLEKTILNNVENFKEEASIVKEFLNEKLLRISQTKNSLLYLDKKQLLIEQNRKSILHFVLAPFGFNASQLEDILKNIDTNGLVGKNFMSSTHTLTIDRLKLIVRENQANKNESIQLLSFESFKNNPLFKLEKVTRFSIPGKNELMIDPTRIIFPLTIRPRIKGDKFKPFGMKGFKLLSDFFKEQKLNTFDKNNCRLLVNGNDEIIWVVGYRSDERYRLKKKNTEILKLTFVG